jgi:hypothetical protein
MSAYLKGVLLPLTTLDDWLAPTGYDGSRYSFYGFHCTVWMKFFVASALLLPVLFVENIMEDAAYIKSEFYASSKPFSGFTDVLSAMDRGKGTSAGHIDLRVEAD